MMFQQPQFGRQFEMAEEVRVINNPLEKLRQESPFVYLREGETLTQSATKKLSTLGKFEYGKTIGAGKYAKVVDCRLDGKPLVLKIQTTRLEDLEDYNVLKKVRDVVEDSVNEVEIMLHLQDLDLSPRVHCFYCFYSEAQKTIMTVILMEKLEMMEPLLESRGISIVDACRKAIETIDKLIDAGITHADFKWNNLGYRKSDNEEVVIVPFDFGMSRFTHTKDVYVNLVDMDLYRITADSLCLSEDVFSTQEYQDMVDRFRSPTMKSFTIKGDMFFEIRDEYNRSYCINFPNKIIINRPLASS